MIGIVDYGLGNLASIHNMLNRLEIENQVTSDTNKLSRCDRLILPGVGAFDQGIENIYKLGLWNCLVDLVCDAKLPILGICLGAQLLTEKSEEGEKPGFGWIKGRTIAFDRTRLDEHNRIPNMGWRYVECVREHPLVFNLPHNPRFYFVHSFHLTCDDNSDVLLTAKNGYEFVCGVAKGNVLGVQFHPEKSHRFGMAILKNFASLTVA